MMSLVDAYCHALLAVQPTWQSPATGALPVTKAATDPTLEGQGFKYFAFLQRTNQRKRWQ